MQIGALSFRPYIYNTNVLSRSSLSRVSSIGDDLLTQKTDYSALTDESLNVNPLKKGQSASFVDILEMQMQMGRMNASRIMKPNEDEPVQVVDGVAAKEPSRPENSEEMAGIIAKNESAVSMGRDVEDFQPASNIEEMQSMESYRNLFMMQRVAAAYQSGMIA